MSTKTPAELAFERRQAEHVFMTSDEAAAWNDKQPMNPVKQHHWSVKAAADKDVSDELVRLRDRVKQLECIETELVTARSEIKVLHQIRVHCKTCNAESGQYCSFQCDRSSSRYE